jgi:hypothetical protein
MRRGSSLRAVARDVGRDPHIVLIHPVRYGLVDVADDREIVGAYTETRSLRAVAAQLGIGVETARRRLVAAGLELPGRGRPAPMDDGNRRIGVLVRRYEAGETLAAIASDVGMAPNSVRRRLLEAGVVLRPRGPRPRSA